MGHKVNPTVVRLGMSEYWRSRWFSQSDFPRLLKQDILIRKYLKNKLREAGIDRIDIERSRGELIITVIAAKPGIIIGRGGTGIEDVRKEIIKQFVPAKTTLKINIQEVENANLSAGSILQACISDIEKRIPFRRVMKQNIDKVLKAGAKGVKICMSGRLNGAEIARTEILSQGTLPLHTLRANINYTRGAAQTTYGVIGIKVWIYKGLYFEDVTKNQQVKDEEKAVPAVKRQTRRASEA